MPREKKYEKFSAECANFMLKTFGNTNQWFSRDYLMERCGKEGLLGKPGEKPEDYKSVSRFYNAIRMLRESCHVIVQKDDDHVTIRNGRPCHGTRMKYLFLSKEAAHKPYQFPFDNVDNTKALPKNRIKELVTEAYRLHNQYCDKMAELQKEMMDGLRDK